MDIKNIVTEQNTETLDAEITAMTEAFTEEHYLNNDEAEHLEMIVAKSMVLGELYERAKWQAKSQAVPECAWVESYDGSIFKSSCGHTFELSNDGTLDDNNMKHCCFCGGKIEEQEQSHESD
ncbi:hypothetical protein [Acinetobacter sp. NigerLNRRAM0016]